MHIRTSDPTNLSCGEILGPCRRAGFPLPAELGNQQFSFCEDRPLSFASHVGRTPKTSTNPSRGPVAPSATRPALRVGKDKDPFTVHFGALLTNESYMLETLPF